MIGSYSIQTRSPDIHDKHNLANNIKHSEANYNMYQYLFYD